MTSARIAERVDALLETGMVIGEAIARAVTEHAAGLTAGQLAQAAYEASTDRSVRPETSAALAGLAARAYEAAA